MFCKAGKSPLGIVSLSFHLTPLIKADQPAFGYVIAERETEIEFFFSNGNELKIRVKLPSPLVGPCPNNGRSSFSMPDGNSKAVNSAFNCWPCLVKCSAGGWTRMREGYWMPGGLKHKAKRIPSPLFGMASDNSFRTNKSSVQYATNSAVVNPRITTLLWPRREQLTEDLWVLSREDHFTHAFQGALATHCLPRSCSFVPVLL